MSLAKKGKPPWNKGLKGHPSCKGFNKKHSEETKAKISENRKGKCLGNQQGFKKGMEPWNKGIPYFIHDAEWRTKVSKANSKENHWNWKGGITSQNQRMRNSFRHKEWSKAVYARDKWTCQKCGLNDHHKIIAHHIVEWSKDPSLRFDVSNGVTLCRSCHMSLHKPRRNYKSPKVQLI
ncbi:MAG: HNH endonuclease [Patescibacteria group bacterium]|nr:HNH endonuclease [Patescibacteria group bacterium]